MRIGEILSLTTDDIDFEEGTIDINKTLTKDLNDKVILERTIKTITSKRTLLMDKRTRKILEEVYEQKKLINNFNKFLFYIENIIARCIRYKKKIVVIK